MMGFIAWTGATLMVVASFLMATQYGPMIAVAGLLLLTIQSANNRTHNLTALNICSILGFLYSLFGG
jgi:hypothetical protein